MISRAVKWHHRAVAQIDQGVVRYPAPMHRVVSECSQLSEALWTSFMPSPHLTRAIRPTGRAPLRTLDDVCAYIIGLPGNMSRMPLWQSTAALAVKTGKYPTESALDELTKQVELALFVSHQLDLTPDRDRTAQRSRRAGR
jgi:hypothetical protein